MAWIDWLMLFILAGAVFSGLAEGFLRSVCSLGGLFFGVLLAVWNYDAVAGLLKPIFRFDAVADALGFLLIVALVTALANLLGKLLHSTARTVGLGCLDRLLGGVFGFFQGWLFVTVIILIVAAFFPHAQWVAEGRMTHLFFSSCHFGSHLGPAELAHRIRDGLDQLAQHTPAWLHRDAGSL